MKVNVKQQGERVLINIDDRTFIDIGWQEALEFSAIVRQIGLLAETHAKRPLIAHDSAILMRAGLPFTLSRDPAVLDAAKNIAVGDRALRRAMPSIRSSEVFGTPTITVQAPEKVQ